MYGKTETLWFAGRPLPDMATPKGYELTDTLRIIYFSLFDDKDKAFEDFEKSLAILDAFAYPIIMGYASETGSFQSVIKEYYTYGNYILPSTFQNSGYKYMGNYAKLLYRLWRVKSELMTVFNMNIEDLKKNINTVNLLCFDGTEITPASIEKYHKKLEEELKKIQNEIEVFRKNNLK